MAQLKDGTRVYGTFTANTEVVIGTLNVASTLVAGYGVANAAFAAANASYGQANTGLASANSWSNTVGLSTNTYTSILAANNAIAANAWANTVGVSGNSYTNHVGLSVNTYTSILVSNNSIGSNNWANTVGVSGNSYTDYVGLSANTYASILVANNSMGTNAWSNSVGIAGNAYADFVGASSNEYMISVTTAGNNYTYTTGISGNNYTDATGVAGNNYTDFVGVSGNSYTDSVGVAGNNYASILVANNSIGSNNWANTVGYSGNSYTDYVGQSGNSRTFILITDSVAGANGWSNTVGYAGNNYTSILVAKNAVGANNWANTKLSNSTGTLEGTLTVTGNLGVGKNPEYNLDVNGQSRLGSGVNAQNPSSTDIKSTAHTILGGNGGNYLSFGQYDTSNGFAQWIQSSFDNPTTATYDIVVNPLGGNLGIGKTPGAFKVDIAGSINSAALFVNGQPVVTGTIDLSPANNYSGSLANTANLFIETVYQSVNSNWVVTNTVYDVANAAFASANNVAPQIEPSYVTANLAYRNSNAAYDHSNTTYNAVNSAFVLTNTSYASINSNWTVTNALYSVANSAFDAANNVGPQIAPTYNTANAAYNKANAAYNGSNSNYITTNAAFDKANAAYNTTNAAFDKANAAYNTTNAAYDFANTRFSSSGGVISGSVEINADLTVHGNTIFVDQSTLRVGDPLIYLAANNYTSDVVDIGFVANYVNTGGQNVHTGLYRSSGTKEYYLFYGYDREPYNNYIDPAGNNITMAVLNADIKTSNLSLGGTNTINWIRSVYDTTNASFSTANSSFDKVNATATAANSYALTTATSIGTAANSYALTTATSIGTAGNNYTNYVGASANAVTATKVASVSGTSGRITSSGGTTPTIDLATAGAGAATYSSGISALTVDAYGRLTSVTGNANYITNSISTNFTTTAKFVGGALQFDSYANWGAGSAGGAGIVNSNEASYQALMIVGNSSAGGNRIVKLWDDLVVNGTVITPTISSPTISGTLSNRAHIQNQTLTDGATINWDVNSGAVAYVTLGGARTMAAPTNLKVGTYILHVIQDGTGSRTITWNSVFKWPAGIAPVLTTTAGRRDIISFICDGTNLYGSYLPDVR